MGDGGGGKSICKGIVILKEPLGSEVDVEFKQMFSVLLTLLGIKIVVLFVLRHFIEPGLQSLVHFVFMLNEA